MGLGRVEDAWKVFTVRQVCEKYLANGTERCLLCVYLFGKGI